MHPLVKILLLIIALQLVQLGYLGWLTHRRHELLQRSAAVHYGSMMPLLVVGLAGLVVVIALVLNLRIFG